MAWVSQRPWKPDGPPRLRFCEPGGWRVASFELAPQIAHIHANVLKAVRAAEQDNASLRVQGHILPSHYQGPHNKRLLPCRLLSRVGLIATFEHLHSVPACPKIRTVLAEYLCQFDEKEAAERRSGLAVQDILNEELERLANGVLPAFAAPAPDSAPTKQSLADIRLPDPETDDLSDQAELGRLFAAIPPPASWEINAAVLTLERAGMDRSTFNVVDDWNRRRLEGLLGSAQSWAEVGALYSAKDPGREAA